MQFTEIIFTLKVLDETNMGFLWWEIKRCCVGSPSQSYHCKSVGTMKVISTSKLMMNMRVALTNC